MELGNPILRALDVAEMESSGQSLEDSLLDYLTYGTVGALTSAAVGFYNTGIALGEAVGVADEDDYLDEVEAVREVGGDAAADFYRRHKTGVDVAGFVAGSIVPGAAAVKALRAAQRSGKLSPLLENATGLHNTDLVLGSKAMDAARAQVLAQANFGLNNPAVWRAYAQGFKQQTIEALVAEAAIVATNNQNAMVNPDDLGYFEAAGQQLAEGAPFVALGAGIGGGLEMLRIRGSLKRAFRDEEFRTAYLRNPRLASTTGLAPGDAILSQLRLYDEFKNGDLFQVDPNDANAVRAKQHGESIIKRAIMDELAKANKAGAAGLEFLNEIVNPAGEIDFAKVDSLLSGVRAVKLFGKQEFDTNVAFAGKSVAPTAIADSAEAMGQLISQLIDDAGIAAHIGDSDRSALIDRLKRVINLGNEGDPLGFAYPPINSEGTAPLIDGYTMLRSSLDPLNSPLFLRVRDSILYGTMVVNKATIDRVYETVRGSYPEILDIMNRVRDAVGMPKLSVDDLYSTTFLHELSHIKSNSAKHLGAVMEGFEKLHGGNKKAEKLIREFFDLSRTRRVGLQWETFYEAQRLSGMSFGEVVSAILHSSNIDSLPPALRPYFNDYRSYSLLRDYLMNPKELWADAGAALTDPATREQGARMAPTVAKLLNKLGGHEKAFSAAKQYYNRRTGATNTWVLPGVNDFNDVQITGDTAVIIPSLNKTIRHNSKLFATLAEDARTKEFFKAENSYLDYSAQWALAQNRDLSQYISKRTGMYTFDADDLPTIEKFVTTDLGEDVIGVRLRRADGEEVLTKEELTKYLIQRKQQLRAALSLTGRFNDYEIAHMLNIDRELAMGMNSGGDWILLGKRDFSKPENIVMEYTPISPSDYNVSARSYEAATQREALAREVRQQAAASALGETYNKLPPDSDVTLELMDTISQTDSRVGMLSAARPDFNTFRERAAYIGNIVRQAKLAANQAITKTFASWYEKFNRADNGKLRTELAMATNLLRRDHHYLFNTPNGSVLVRKDFVMNPDNWDGAKYNYNTLSQDQEALDFILSLAADPKNKDAHLVSGDVAEFLTMHMREKRALDAKKAAIAKAQGKTYVIDPDVVYAPPMDLRTTPHFAFAVPSKFMEGADPRKFMVYGRTAEELQNKIDVIKRKYGNSYQVFNKSDVEDFKKLRGEYDRGEVFDEIFFDSELRAEGTAAELIPNLDLEVSNTLDRYKSWHHQQAEFVINAGTELKYADVFEQLRRADREFDAAAQSTIFKGRAKASIYKDTERMMLDDIADLGFGANLWTRVNDYIGEAGSKVLDQAVYNLWKTFKGKGRITQDDLNSYNDHLAKLGYEPPLRDVMQAILVSPDTQVTRSLPHLVRTLNNLTSTFMLRLDMAHSIITTISTPILMLPVLREAKQALRGTAQGQLLEQLTTVVNPANGMKEPSPMKLIMNSTRRFFSEEGRQFATELQARGLLPDYLNQYLDVTDFSQLNGRHTLKVVNDKIDALAQFGGKFSGFQLAENFSRFIVADAVFQIGAIRGIPREELFSIASSAIDKVHGIYRSTQRPQLFQGVVGQAIGLYQTYFFNFMQNALKYLQDADRKNALILGAMQGTIFGARSLPGFSTFNQMIADTNSGNLDLYSITNAEDPNSLGAYFMYGLGSHVLGIPIDFFSRGDLVVRNSLVVPTTIQDIPAVSILAKAVSNALNVGEMLGMAAEQRNLGLAKEALLHGLAHNGLNRPLQGLGTIALGYVASGEGQLYFDNANYINYDAAEELNFGAMFARLLGTRPLNESIYMDTYFRKKAYQANMNEKLQEISQSLQLGIHSGSLRADAYSRFARQYEEIGGDPENFRAYWTRQLTRSRTEEVNAFRKEMERDSALSRLAGRLDASATLRPIWEDGM